MQEYLVSTAYTDRQPTQLIHCFVKRVALKAFIYRCKLRAFALHLDKIQDSLNSYRLMLFS